MDLPRIEQLKEDLLQNRKLLLTVGVLVVMFWVVTIAGGYLLVKHAIAEDRTSVNRPASTPTQVGLLFEDKNTNQIVNHIVYFNDVRLEPGPTDNVYFAVGSAGQKVMVIATGNKAPVDEAMVDLQGTARAVPAAATLKKWKLSKDQQKAVHDQGIYIEADAIHTKHAAAQAVAKK